MSELWSDTRVTLACFLVLKIKFYGNTAMSTTTSSLWLQSSVVTETNSLRCWESLLSGHSQKHFLNPPCTRKSVCEFWPFCLPKWQILGESFKVLSCFPIYKLWVYREKKKAIIEFFWESFDIVNVNILLNCTEIYKP